MQKKNKPILQIAVFLIFQIFVCMHIYVYAYKVGSCITTDSARYMREALNLAAGNGFRMDGLSGHDTWFASWPILFPAILSLAMKITGLNIYLASKFVIMGLVAIMLLTIFICFKQNRLLYLIVFLNPGFLEIIKYTWSETPFMVMELLFVICFAKIASEETPDWFDYFLLGLTGTLAFLIRYVGLYLWMAAGVYSLGYIIRYFKKREKNVLKKIAGLTVSAGTSGIICISYLAMNKMMCGFASGVKRDVLSEDYVQLTHDLIDSLLTEFSHIILIECPGIIANLIYPVKVVVLICIFGALVYLILKKIEYNQRAFIFIFVALAYYVIFIIVRYFSDMDTFSFRFFAPGTFLLSIGLVEAFSDNVMAKSIDTAKKMPVLVVFALLCLCVSIGGEYIKYGNETQYEVLNQFVLNNYKEIPPMSAVQRDDYNYQETIFMRPDIQSVSLKSDYSYDEWMEMLQGSKYYCLYENTAREMVESGEYQEDITEWIKNELEHGDLREPDEQGNRFLIIELNR